MQIFVDGTTLNAAQLNVLMQSCDTIADLRGFTGIPGMQINVRGYYAAGDGGGGPPFFWVDTSTDADDGGLVINPTGNVNPGRWIRGIMDGNYHADHFGARGNGVTLDTAAIQATFNAAPDGANVVFSGGRTYLIDDTLINAAGRPVNVIAYGARILQSANKDIALFSATPTDLNAIASIAPAGVLDPWVVLSTTANQANFLTGDIVKIVSDGICPKAVDPSNGAGTGATRRMGEFNEVVAVAPIKEVMVTVDANFVDITNDTIDTGGVTSEFAVADPVQFTALTGATLPGGLVAATTYYVGNVVGSRVSFYNTATNATAGGTTGRVDITSVGTGTIKIDHTTIGIVLLDALRYTHVDTPKICRMPKVTCGWQGGEIASLDGHLAGAADPWTNYGITFRNITDAVARDVRTTNIYRSAVRMQGCYGYIMNGCVAPSVNSNAYPAYLDAGSESGRIVGCLADSYGADSEFALTNVGDLADVANVHLYGPTVNFVADACQFKDTSAAGVIQTVAGFDKIQFVSIAQLLSAATPITPTVPGATPTPSPTPAPVPVPTPSPAPAPTPAPTGFSPSQTTGLEIWYDFSDQAHITDNAGRIATIASEVNTHAASAPSGSQPINHAAAINSLSAADWDGTYNIYLQTPQAAPINDLWDGGGTVMVLVSMRTPGATPYYSRLCDKGNWWLGISEDGPIELNFNVNLAGGQCSWNFAPSNTWSFDGGPFLIEIDWNSATPSIAPTARVNGVPLSVDFIFGDPSGGAYTSDATTDLFFGGGNLNGEIGEVLIWPNALASTDRTNVRSYISSKWNIGVAATPSPSPTPTSGGTSPTTTFDLASAAAPAVTAQQRQGWSCIADYTFGTQAGSTITDFTGYNTYFGSTYPNANRLNDEWEIYTDVAGGDLSCHEFAVDHLKLKSVINNRTLYDQQVSRCLATTNQGTPDGHDWGSWQGGSGGPSGFNCGVSSGMVWFKRKQKYGYFEWLSQVPPSSKGGAWPANWMVDGDLGGWPPEVDVLEMAINNSPDNSFNSFHNVATRPGGTVDTNPKVDVTTLLDQYGSYHGGFDQSAAPTLYGVLWQPGDARGDLWTIYVNQVAVWNGYYPWKHPDGTPAGPAYFYSNLAFGGNWPGRNGAASDPTVFPVVDKLFYFRMFNFPVLTRFDGVVTSTAVGQVIENLDIYSTTDGITISHNNVTVRNCRIHHAAGCGILASNVTGLKIQNCEIIETSPPAGIADGPSAEYIGVHLISCPATAIDNVTTRDAASGFYLVFSDGSTLNRVDSYNVHGPFPRGQHVQFDHSPNCTLTNFYGFNDPTASSPQDSVSVYSSTGVHVSNGVLDGNIGTTSAAVQVEAGSTGTLVEDVDCTHMLNAGFATYADSVTFNRCHTFDSYGNVDKGKGLPSSGCIEYVIQNPTAGTTNFNSCTYSRPGNNVNISFDQTKAGTFDVTEAATAQVKSHDAMSNVWNWQT